MTAPESTPTLDPPAGPGDLAGPGDVAAPARSLRVAVFSDAIPSRNGVGTYYDDLVAHLRGAVAHVRLFCPPPDPRGSELGWSLPLPGDPTQKLFLPRIPRLWAEVREMAPDVVVSATPGIYGLLGMTAASRLGAGFAVGHHTQIDKLADLYWSGALGRLTRWGLGALDRFMFQGDAVVLVHNEDLVEVARRAGARTVRLMGTPTPRVFVDRPRAPVPTQVESVLFVGRLAPEKELGQIIEVARRRPALRVRIAGDGPLRSEVARAARELPNLEAPGWVDRDRVLELLDAHDLVVLPSRYETFGSAAFEAMIRGRPTLVSPNCGITRWEGLSRGLFVMEEGEELVEAVDRVRELPAERRTEVVERGVREARAMLRATVENWLDVLASTAARGSRR